MKSEIKPDRSGKGAVCPGDLDFPTESQDSDVARSKERSARREASSKIQRALRASKDFGIRITLHI